MQTTFIIAAVATAFAASASAVPYPPPYALTAVHADFGAQLDQVASRPDTIGAAARAAAALLGPHNAAQERLVLPLLGWADTAATGQPVTDHGLTTGVQSLEAELSRLHEGEADVVTALAELYAVADQTGQTAIADLAERMIWHETTDSAVLYPAAALVGSALGAQRTAMPAASRPAPGPLYGLDPVPMMGVGNPHGPKIRQ